jgi:hypothetical protein
MSVWVGTEPMISIIAEPDLKGYIYSLATEYRGKAQGQVEFEVHEFDDTVSTTDAFVKIAAERRQPLDREVDFTNTLFDWGMSYLQQVRPGGRVQTSRPISLPVPVIVQTLSRLATQPEYKGQTFELFTRTDQRITLKDGEVTVTEKP